MKSFPGWLGAPWPLRRLPSPAPVPSSGVDTPQDSVSRVQVELTKQYIKEGENPDLREVDDFMGKMMECRRGGGEWYSSGPFGPKEQKKLAGKSLLCKQARPGR